MLLSVYRGYAEDEVAATLEYAPQIGYRLMEIHGPLILEASMLPLRFDIHAMKAKVDASWHEVCRTLSARMGWTKQHRC